jgi:hypothetical protein
MKFAVKTHRGRNKEAKKRVRFGKGAGTTGIRTEHPRTWALELANAQRGHNIRIFGLERRYPVPPLQSAICPIGRRGAQRENRSQKADSGGKIGCWNQN